MLYFDQFTDFKKLPDFCIMKIMRKKKILEILYYPIKILDVTFLSFFSFSKDRFSCGMVKQRNFLHVVDLSFDSRFVKFYQFSLHYPINNIKVKTSQIGQTVSDIF